MRLRLALAALALAALALAASPAVHAQQTVRAPAEGGPDTLAALSDEFTDPASLRRWSRFDGTDGWPDMLRRAEVDPSGSGTLVLDPATSGWYADFHGAYLYKEVTGDFDVVVRLEARGHAGELPTRNWSLAGLMVREPRPVTPQSWTPNGENWLFLTTGIGDRPGEAAFESKTTVNSRSNLKLRPARPGWVELRVVRLREAFILLHRYPGGEWTVHERFLRRDLPRTVQVGIAAYTDWDSARPYWNDPVAFNTRPIAGGSPGLLVNVDYVRFRRPQRPEGVRFDELTDYSLSNEQVAKLLGI